MKNHKFKRIDIYLSGDQEIAVKFLFGMSRLTNWAPRTFLEDCFQLVLRTFPLKGIVRQF